MKRAELKRGQPLERKKPMPRGEGPKRKAWMSSGGKALERATTRKPKARPKTTPKPVVDLVKTRSGGLCEIGLLCMGIAPATERAHRCGKGSGGIGKKNTWSNTPSNLLDGCSQDHALIDNAEVADAERLGLKLRHTVARPAEMPVYHFTHGWVLLDDAGGYRPATRAAWDRDGGPVLPIVAAVESSEPGWFTLPRETLQRFGHHECRGFEWDEEFVVSCLCGALDLFIAEVPR